jgi:chromate reductase
MAEGRLNVITICGSLRKGSYNAALARALPALAPQGLSIKPAPAWDKFPVYNADIQNSTGFPPEVTVWADAIRAADAIIIVSPEYNWSIPGGLKIGKPEVFVNFSAKKFDEKTLELTDQPTIDMVKQQLAGFEKFVRRLNGAK